MEFDFEKDIQSKDIHLISYGFQFTMPEDFNAKKKVDSVEKELGFYWENYGCMVDSESNVLANDYNENVIKYLGKRNGVDWFKKYINLIFNEIILKLEILSARSKLRREFYFFR